MKKIIIILGTRPEAIKLAPLVLALKALLDRGRFYTTKKYLIFCESV